MQKSRSNSKSASITYLWWIDDWKRTSLTWSSTLLELNSRYRNAKVLIDYWLFQWWKSDVRKNSQVDQRALTAEYIILTHAHLDHSWRLPLLVKKWFSWKIFMTDLTKRKVEHILLDYVKILKEDRDRIAEKNNKIRRQLTDALFIRDSIDSMNWSSKEDQRKSRSKLAKKIWNKSFKEARKESVKILQSHWVESKEDIEDLLNEVPELLYDEQDIYKMLWMTTVVDVWDEIWLKDYVHIRWYWEEKVRAVLDAVD